MWINLDPGTVNETNFDTKISTFYEGFFVMKCILLEIGPSQNVISRNCNHEEDTRFKSHN